MTGVFAAPLAVQGQDIGAGRYFNGEPSVLQFSCAVMIDADEEASAETLANGAPAARVVAARILWNANSRRHAAEVLDFIEFGPADAEGFAALKRDVEADIQPDAILRGLKHGRYAWISWLAFQRPDARFVPTLLEALRDPAHATELPETILALGATKDRRAVDPLTELLKGESYVIGGHAAQALGWLGLPEAEPALLQALEMKGSWRQAKAAWALGRVGTDRSLPTLERIANDRSPSGAINAHGSAQRAIDQINARLKRPAATQPTAPWGVPARTKKNETGR